MTTNKLTQIEHLIYEIRGHKVMLDSDLAVLYEVQTFRLNEAVKRNIERFPDDFIFQLTEDEYESLRSQNAILNKASQKPSASLRGKHRKYLPYVFTEQGVAGLSGVLKSEIAGRVHVDIMRAFVKLRHYVLSQSGTNEQIAELRRLLMLHIENTDYKLSEHDKAIEQIIIALNNLIEQPPEPKRKIGFK